MTSARIRFAAVGLNHNHIYNMCACLIEAGAELASVYAPELELLQPFMERFPQVNRARGLEEILDDATIGLVVCAAIPSEQAPLGVVAMRRGKDFLSDKPGFTTLAQLEEVRRVNAETGRRYLVYFSERFESRATVKASELVRQGAIGPVVHIVGLGPHQLGLFPRPAWFFDRVKMGGILTDLASHQMDQFLHFTGGGHAKVVAASVANVSHLERPDFEDVGEATLRNAQATGMLRVDWLSPAGLGSWGDGRLFLLGTEGYIEIRKTCDLAGRSDGGHLFVVNAQDARYLDCKGEALPFGKQILTDLRERSETAVTQAHCFQASALALEAQAMAWGQGVEAGGAET